MSMSKKDFIALADTIRDYNQFAERTGQRTFYNRQLELLADFCHQQNPNFKHERWLDYIAGKCGKNGGAVKKGNLTERLLDKQPTWGELNE